MCRSFFYLLLSINMYFSGKRYFQGQLLQTGYGDKSVDKPKPKKKKKDKDKDDKNIDMRKLKSMFGNDILIQLLLKLFGDKLKGDKSDKDKRDKKPRKMKRAKGVTTGQFETKKQRDFRRKKQERDAVLAREGIKKEDETDEDYLRRLLTAMMNVTETDPLLKNFINQSMTSQGGTAFPAGVAPDFKKTIAKLVKYGDVLTSGVYQGQPLDDEKKLAVERETFKTLGEIGFDVRDKFYQSRKGSAIREGIDLGIGYLNQLYGMGILSQMGGGIEIDEDGVATTKADGKKHSPKKKLSKKQKQQAQAVAKPVTSFFATDGPPELGGSGAPQPTPTEAGTYVDTRYGKEKPEGTKARPFAIKAKTKAEREAEFQALLDTAPGGTESSTYREYKATFPALTKEAYSNLTSEAQEYYLYDWIWTLAPKLKEDNAVFSMYKRSPDDEDPDPRAWKLYKEAGIHKAPKADAKGSKSQREAAYNQMNLGRTPSERRKNTRFWLARKREEEERKAKEEAKKGDDDDPPDPPKGGGKVAVEQPAKPPRAPEPEPEPQPKLDDKVSSAIADVEDLELTSPTADEEAEAIALSLSLNATKKASPQEKPVTADDMLDEAENPFRLQYEMDQQVKQAANVAVDTGKSLTTKPAEPPAEPPPAPPPTPGSEAGTDISVATAEAQEADIAFDTAEAQRELEEYFIPADWSGDSKTKLKKKKQIDRWKKKIQDDTAGKTITERQQAILDDIIGDFWEDKPQTAHRKSITGKLKTRIENIVAGSPLPEEKAPPKKPVRTTTRLDKDAPVQPVPDDPYRFVVTDPETGIVEERNLFDDSKTALLLFDLISDAETSKKDQKKIQAELDEILNTYKYELMKQAKNQDLEEREGYHELMDVSDPRLDGLTGDDPNLFFPEYGFRLNKLLGGDGRLRLQQSGDYKESIVAIGPLGVMIESDDPDGITRYVKHQSKQGTNDDELYRQIQEQKAEGTYQEGPGTETTTTTESDAPDPETGAIKAEAEPKDEPDPPPPATPATPIAVEDVLEPAEEPEPKPKKQRKKRVKAHTAGEAGSGGKALTSLLASDKPVPADVVKPKTKTETTFSQADEEASGVLETIQELDEPIAEVTLDDIMEGLTKKQDEPGVELVITEPTEEATTEYETTTAGGTRRKKKKKKRLTKAGKLQELIAQSQTEEGRSRMTPAEIELAERAQLEKITQEQERAAKRAAEYNRSAGEKEAEAVLERAQDISVKVDDYYQKKIEGGYGTDSVSTISDTYIPPAVKQPAFPTDPEGKTIPEFREAQQRRREEGVAEETLEQRKQRGQEEREAQQQRRAERKQDQARRQRLAMDWGGLAAEAHSIEQKQAEIEEKVEEYKQALIKAGRVKVEKTKPIRVDLIGKTSPFKLKIRERLTESELEEALDKRRKLLSRDLQSDIDAIEEQLPLPKAERQRQRIEQKKTGLNKRVLRKLQASYRDAKQRQVSDEDFFAAVNMGRQRAKEALPVVLDEGQEHQGAEGGTYADLHAQDTPAELEALSGIEKASITGNPAYLEKSADDPIPDDVIEQIRFVYTQEKQEPRPGVVGVSVEGSIEDTYNQVRKIWDKITDKSTETDISQARTLTNAILGERDLVKIRQQQARTLLDEEQRRREQGTATEIGIQRGLAPRERLEGIELEAEEIKREALKTKSEEEAEAEKQRYIRLQHSRFGFRLAEPEVRAYRPPPTERERYEALALAERTRLQAPYDLDRPPPQEAEFEYLKGGKVKKGKLRTQAHPDVELPDFPDFDEWARLQGITDKRKLKSKKLREQYDKEKEVSDKIYQERLDEWISGGVDRRTGQKYKGFKHFEKKVKTTPFPVEEQVLRGVVDEVVEQGTIAEGLLYEARQKQQEADRQAAEKRQKKLRKQFGVGLPAKKTKKQLEQEEAERERLADPVYAAVRGIVEQVADEHERLEEDVTDYNAPGSHTDAFDLPLFKQKQPKSPKTEGGTTTTTETTGTTGTGETPGSGTLEGGYDLGPEGEDDDTFLEEQMGGGHNMEQGVGFHLATYPASGSGEGD